MPAVTPAATAYLQGELGSAEALAGAELAAAPSIAAYAMLVRVEIERNELAAALATAQKAIATYPGDASAQSLVGDAQLRAGDVRAAYTAYVAALKIDGCTARAHLGHARIDEMVGRHAAAAGELNVARMQAPLDAEVTRYWVESLPVTERATPLRALLGSSPLLAPPLLAHLQGELATLDQHKLCTPVNTPETARLLLYPVRPSGAVIRSWGLEVGLNDKAKPLMELDSTVEGIVLNPRDAAKAGVRPLTGPGDGKSYLGVADTIRIGELQFKDCVVRVVPGPELADANSLIGTSFFRDHLIHIDYVDKAVTLSALPAPGGMQTKDWAAVYIDGANVLMSTNVGEQAPVLFALDTGAEYTTLSPAMVTPGSRHMEMKPEVKGYSGEDVKVVIRDDPNSLGYSPVTGPDGKRLATYSIFYRPALRFVGNGRLLQEPVVFDISPKSHAAGVEISGLLGFDILYDYFIDIDYRDSLVKIAIDPKHLYRERTVQKLQ